MSDLPRVLADLTPAPGRIKTHPDDFEVEEVPLYPADGAGPHTYFLVEKMGISSLLAAQEVAHALNVPRREIGLAGLKDARAVTRQWMSVEHVDPTVVAALQLPRLRILETTRHRNKLRIGHLKGNHFRIRVRGFDERRLGDVQTGMHTLTAHGVPNYFGPQRFGLRGDTWRIGAALLKGDVDDALDQLLGRPAATDRADLRRARELYQQGEFEAAVRAWPGLFRDERRALKVLARTGGNKRHALGAIDRRTRGFYVSACQSQLFNHVVAARVATGLDQLCTGDLAWLHASGAVFRVEDAAREQPRAAAFEISPTGPLFGPRMTEPGGTPAELEARVLADENLRPDVFAGRHLRVAGGRRPVRFQPQEAAAQLGADGRGPYLELRFFLPRGCYATTLLRELFSGEAAAVAEESDEETELGAS